MIKSQDLNEIIVFLDFVSLGLSGTVLSALLLQSNFLFSEHPAIFFMNEVGILFVLYAAGQYMGARACGQFARLRLKSLIFEHRSAVDIEVNEQRSRENQGFTANIVELSTGPRSFSRFFNKMDTSFCLLMTQSAKSLLCGLLILSVLFKSYPLMLISRFLQGFCAGDLALIQAFAIQRSQNSNETSSALTRIQLCIGLGWIIGPIAGYLMGTLASDIPRCALMIFVVMSAVHFLWTLVLWWAHQKSKGTDILSCRCDERPELLNSASEVHSVGDERKIVWVWSLFVLASTLFVQYIPTLLILEFQLDFQIIYCLLAWMGFIYTGSQCLITQKVINSQSFPERIPYFLLASGSIALILMYGEKLSFWAFLLPLFSICTACLRPGLIKHATQFVKTNSMGWLQGKITAQQALMTLFANMVGGVLLSFHEKGIYMVAATLFVCAACLMHSLKERETI